MKKESRATLRDTAAKAGVSISTVHLVLAGKPGPKEETRKRVMEVSKALNYQCNSVASSLKRGVTRIAAILPALAEDNLFYYTPIWNGVRAYVEQVKDFNVELVEIPYENKDLVAVPVEAALRVKSEEKIMGLIALGKIAPDAMSALKTMSDGGLPIVLVNSDTPEIGRICCVQADNYMLGSIMGEILFRQTPRGGSVLVCAGDQKMPANLESVQGLENFFFHHDKKRIIYKIHNGDDMGRLYRELIEHFHKHDDIAGCCSVTARGSIQLARALSDTGKAAAMPAIGSDLFLQNIDSLENGTFVNLMFKNPFQQGWTAAEELFNYVIRNQRPGRDIIFVKSEVIFQSSISMYRGSSK